MLFFTLNSLEGAKVRGHLYKGAVFIRGADGLQNGVKGRQTSGLPPHPNEIVKLRSWVPFPKEWGFSLSGAN